MSRRHKTENNPPNNNPLNYTTGRPEINQLCSMVEDSDIWIMAEEIYQKVYQKSILQAKNLVQYLVCYLCSLFRRYNTETVFGRVAHFHRLIAGHIDKGFMPTLRSLQGKLKWFMEWSSSVIRTVKEIADEANHQAWEKLVEQIFEIMSTMVPQ